MGKSWNVKNGRKVGRVRMVEESSLGLRFIRGRKDTDGCRELLW